MISDLNDIADGSDLAGDVVIVGAGAAGIVLALELEASGRRVLLLESGGLDYDDATQDLYHGEAQGPLTPIDGSRLRYLGGTTNHWNGRCLPLDPIDFEPRDWVPESGWPFRRETLEDAYARAQPYLELGRFAYDAAGWGAAAAVDLAAASELFEIAIAQRSPPARLGTTFRERIARSTSIEAVLHANVVEIATDADGRVAQGVVAASLADGRRVSFTAPRIVLAAGGIEVPRLLLQPHPTNPNGLANAHDQLGRHFADHPILQGSGSILFDRHQPMADAFTVRHGLEHGFQCILTVDPATQRREGLLNCQFNLMPQGNWRQSAGVESASLILERLRRGRWPDDLLSHLGRVVSELDSVLGYGYERLTTDGRRLFDLAFSCEPPPDASSRITLSDRRDALGLLEPRVSWRIPDAVRDTILRVHQSLAHEAGRLGLGRVRLDEAVMADPLDHVGDSFHHMGATRMHDEPRHGVVDRNLEVHGTANLFVCSSSVFPTYGHANPTLTIAALAVRLADHLKSSEA
jgi:choline dehydrogenase-like flavoprotein